MTRMKDVISAMCSTEEEAKVFRAVVRQFGDWETLYQYPEDYRDAGAGVSGFIYYADTHKFAQRNMDNIMAVLWYFEDELGMPLEKDNNDCLNWLAWFALEHIVQKIMDYKEYNAE